MPVSDNHVAHSYKAPVPQQGDGALVVPRLLAFAEQRPFVEAFFHVVLHETPYGGFGGQGHPRSLELLLDFPHALAHLRPVRVQNVAENDALVFFREHGLPLVGYAPSVSQSQHASGPFLFQFPPLQRLPRYRPDFFQQLGPGSGLVRDDELAFLDLRRPVPALPGKVLTDQIRAGQRLVAPLVVHDGGCCAEGERRNRCGSRAEGQRLLFFGGPDGDARFFRHGAYKPLTATAPCAFPCLPFFSCDTLFNGLSRDFQ